MSECIECGRHDHAMDCTRGPHMSQFCIHCEENRVKVALAPFCSTWCKEKSK